MRLRHIKDAESLIMDYAGLLVVDPEQRKGQWKDVYATSGPLEVELGTGKGKFLRTLSRLHPETRYLGIEVVPTALLYALRRTEDPGENLHFACADADRVNDLFAPGEVDGFYLNFSDPWPKARHSARRLTSLAHLASYAAILPAGGFVEFRTDNRVLFQWSIVEVAKSPLLLTDVSLSFHDDEKELEATTEYEDKFASLGNPIYHYRAVKP